jgi:hypothetical protein
MALVIFKTWCKKCGSKLLATELKNHKCYSDRNYDNESIHLKQTHLVQGKRKGDFCSCGGNQDCRRCGGSGRIS